MISKTDVAEHNRTFVSSSHAEDKSLGNQKRINGLVPIYSSIYVQATIEEQKYQCDEEIMHTPAGDSCGLWHSSKLV